MLKSVLRGCYADETYVRRKKFAIESSFEASDLHKAKMILISKLK